MERGKTGDLFKDNPECLKGCQKLAEKKQKQDEEQ